jgi:hypothetical protein
MKKKLILIYILLVFVGISCNDKEWLEVKPTDRISESNFYTTPEEALFGIIPIYEGNSITNFGSSLVNGEIWSDNAYAGGEAGGASQLDMQQNEKNSSLASSAIVGQLWYKSYYTIYRANTYLANEGRVEGWKTENMRKQFQAEARFLRAIQYWELFRNFGWVPLFREIRPLDDIKNTKQSTPQEMISFLASEFIFASENLPESVDKATMAGRATKYAALGYVARIFLYYDGIKTGLPGLGLSGELTSEEGIVVNRQYAIDACEKIIGSNKYFLLDNYADIFSQAKENNDESIFEIQYSNKSIEEQFWPEPEFTKNYALFIDGAFLPTMVGIRFTEPDATSTNPWVAQGWSYETVSWDLYNEFEPGDSRLYATVFDAEDSLPSVGATVEAAWQHTGYFDNKHRQDVNYPFPGDNNFMGWGNNIIDMRLGEIYLIASELYLADGNMAKAVEYLNKVRTRAMGNASAKTTLTHDDILHERRVELALEGQRKWDLLRMGLNYAKEKIDASFPDPASTPWPDQHEIRLFENLNCYGMYPIPQVEIDNFNDGVLKQYIPYYQ